MHVDWETARTGKLDGTLTVNQMLARQIIADIDADAVQSLADAAMAYLPDVLAGVDELQHAIACDRRHVFTRALVFGASTPGRPVGISVAMARAFADGINWYDDTDDDIAERVYAGHAGANGWNHTQLPGSRDRGYIRTLCELRPFINLGSIPERDAYVGIHGIQHKVASMTHAVIDPEWHGWTIDRHHLRQMLAMSGRNHRVDGIGMSPAAHGAAYHVMEGFWLGYAAQHFPGVPTWAAQWATWDVAFGSHQNHSGIWS